MQTESKLHSLLLLSIGLLLGTIAAPAAAQNITLDGTLGDRRTLPGGNYIIRQEDGQTVGSNLFHSFGRFNLNANESATFLSRPSIRNILSRITGGARSQIDGLIATQSANVNLFLINPNGIVFGPNARVDIGGPGRGSFIATTVDAISFPNGTQFSATNPGNASSLLNIVGDPSGFLASQRRPASIAANGSQLSVYPGQSLLLLGGDLLLNQATLTIQSTPLAAPSGTQVTLGAIAGAGTVELSPNGNALDLRFPMTELGNITIGNGSEINVAGSSGGSLAITGKNLTITGKSRLEAGIAAGRGAPTSQAGDITLIASEAIDLNQDSVIQNGVRELAVGRAGDVLVEADTLSVSGGSAIGSTVLLGQGQAGDIDLKIRDNILFDRTSYVGSLIVLASGDAGNLTIETGTLRVLGGSILGSLPILSQGGSSTINSGDVTIAARDRVILDGENAEGTPSSITSLLALSGGKSGNITIQTGSFSATNGASLVTTTVGSGNAGNITIEARDRVVFDGIGKVNVSGNNGAKNRSSADSSVVAGATGNGGDIRIKTGSLFVTAGGVITSSTQGQGDAGNIRIRAREAVVVDGAANQNAISTIASAIGPQAVGQGGDLDISTGSLTVSNQGILASGNFFGRGNAGDITIASQGDITFADGSLATLTYSEGNAGKATIRAGGRVLLDDSLVITGAFSLTEALIFLRNQGIEPEELPGLEEIPPILLPTKIGKGSDLTVKARSLTLDRESTLTSGTSSGAGGNIWVEVKDSLLLRRESTISTTAGILGLGGSGGNVTIAAGFVVTAPNENSDITANAFSGSGGRVSVTAQGIYWMVPRSRSELERLLATTNQIELNPSQLPTNDITAISQANPTLNGQVILNTPDVDPSRGLVELPTGLVDPTSLIAQRCSQTQRQAPQPASSFYITGTGGLPYRPGEAPLSSYITSTVRSLPAQAATPLPQSTAPSTEPAPFVEAQGWYKAANGEVFLVAQAAKSVHPTPPIEDCP